MNPLYLVGLALAFLQTSKGEEELGAPVTCDPNIHIEGGLVTKSNDNEVSSVAQFECPEPRYPSPVSSSKCLQNGKWSHSLRNVRPVCKGFQCPAPVLEDGIFSPVESSYAVGKTVSLECYDGYTLIGSDRRTCMKNGRWNGTNTICNSGLQDCPNPGIPAGGSKAGTSYDVGDRVQYHCNDRLVLVGSDKRECLESGEWTGAEPMCQHRYSFDMPEEVAEVFSASLTSTLGLTRINDGKIPESLARKIDLSKDADLHIYVMIDASESVGLENYQQAIDVVVNLIDKIASFDVRPRFGVVTYASKPIRVVNLNDEDSSEVDVVIDKMTNSPLAKYEAHTDQRGTNIYEALNSVLEMMAFSKIPFRKSWNDIRFVTILFTDGKANMGGNPRVAVERITQFVRAQNKSEGHLDMYVFGISDNVDLSELNNLASKKINERHSFVVRNTSDLVQAFKDILEIDSIGNLCGVGKESPSATFREKHPWHVNLNIPGSGICSGSIVAPDWVLSAAHCFSKVTTGADIARISVTVGDRSEAFIAKDLALHPGYNIAAKVDKNISQFYDFDVALVQLQNKITYSDSARAICLPCTRETTRALRRPHPKTKCSDHEMLLLPTDAPVQAFFVKENHATKEEREGYVTIKTSEGSRRACEEKALKALEYEKVKNLADVVTDRFLCTGGFDPIKEAISCKGDSGGSLYILKKRRYMQAGVLSWGVINVCEGDNPNEANARDFHINLFKVMSWLKKKLKGSLVFID